MIVEVVRGSGPAVRRANPVREPGRFTRRATTDQDTALPQAPTGPTGRRHVNEPPTAPTGDGRGRRNEVLSMATIKNVCNKIERMSALQGWRMRWHMQ